MFIDDELLYMLWCAIFMNSTYHIPIHVNWRSEIKLEKYVDKFSWWLEEYPEQSCFNILLFGIVEYGDWPWLHVAQFCDINDINTWDKTKMSLFD